MTITFVGHGYVGIVTACVFADLGNTVYVIGRDDAKLEKLKSGDPIIYEPGLSELLKKNIEAHRLIFTKSYKEALENSEIVFIAVGTPPKKTGEADLTSVLQVAENIGKHLKKGHTVVSCKSTVPIGTNRKVLEILNENKQEGATVDIASCPEFLREGTALHDTFNPDRVVIGADSEKARTKLLEVHSNIPGERIMVGIESAEIIKYASNSYLATKISFANLISFISEKAGADVEEILEGVGIDKRIGRIFLYPGVGYGGSCFPKDVKALVKTGEALNVDMRLLQAVDDINEQAKDNYVEKVINNLEGKNIAVWGLAFKPNTDDVREAPATYIIDRLLTRDFKIKAYDPEAMKNIKDIYHDKITFCDKALDTLENADALLILTEWNEFKQIDLEKVKSLMKTPIIFDGRNIYDKKNMLKLGFKYFSIGR